MGESPPILALRERQQVLRRGAGPARRLAGAVRRRGHALVGENGAGKSTLVKILAGVHRPDAGTVLLDGEPVDFRGPADAQRAGIAVIYQEPTLFPDLSVAENIFMGRQPLRPLRPHRPPGHAAPRPRSCSSGSASRSTRTGPPAACPSPTSSSSRSPRRSPSTRGSWSWTSRPPRCPATRWTGCSTSSGRCGSRAPRCCSSRTGWRRSSTLCQRVTDAARRRLDRHRAARRA